MEFRKERQEEEMRWRGETVIADAWVALRSPPITHQSRVGDPSGARARRPVRSSTALIRHGRHSRIHTYICTRCSYEQSGQRKREKSRERHRWRRSCVPAYVRARFVLSVRIPALREQQCTHAVSCDTYCIQKAGLKKNASLST